MSPLRAGRATVVGVSAETLRRRSTALAEALAEGEGHLPEDRVAAAHDVVRKVEDRIGMTGEHTVVALAGATGSGKSSLFNALVGTEVATVGVRRPTTSTPTGAVWGADPATALLDWLGVGARHGVATDTSGARLDGLVLLDLPDVDSREVENRRTAERALDLVDVFVWVTDPQKYADARLHDDFIAALAAHDAVTLVVLNQVDRLSDDGREQCVSDLQRLLRADGLDRAQVVATSTRTGYGLDVLRQRLVNAVAGQDAARTRLAADLTQVTGRLRPAFGGGEARIESEDVRGLRSALAVAAGVPVVTRAVERDYRHSAIGHTGLPWTRWVRRLRPRPLARLRLDQPDEGHVSAHEVDRVLSRSSLPAPTPTARAAVDLAGRRLADRVASDLPVSWADAVHDAASPPEGELADAVDQAILGVPLTGREPAWWKVVGAAQVLLAAAALAGLVWLVVLGVLGWLQLPEIQTPSWGWFPIPFVLLVGGLLAGAVLALLSRWFAGIGARRRARAAEKRLTAAIDGVVDARVVEPIRAVLARRDRGVAALERAAA